MEKLYKLTESDILSLAKEGDNKAFDPIITKYRSLVETVVSKYSDSPIEREDLIQEGMIGLLAAVKSYEAGKGATFNTYCSTCINNSIQTALRKVNRRKDVPKSSVIPLEEEFVNGTTASLSAEDSFLAQESVSVLTRQLNNNLSKFENNVLRLHMVGCSYNEIAEKLGKNPKAIDNALQRIRKKLKAVSF